MGTSNVFISHESALEFWRHHDLDPSGGIKPSRQRSVADGSAVLADIKPLLRHALPTSGRIYGERSNGTLLEALVDLEITTLPLHVMVGSFSSRRTWTSVHAHLFEQTLPEKSFCRIGPHVYVASPELTLCQMAAKLPFIDLLELCLEFCGGYALNPNSERGFDDRPPLTSASRLRSFTQRYKGRRGARCIRPALPYIVDNSASPMESAVLMLLCLPSRLGGHQLPLPQHNVSIRITEKAHSHTKRKHLVCDLYWEDFHLDVECDSTLHHASKRQLGVDSDRRIILDAMGYPYVGITTWQLQHADEFLNVVQAIRRCMGLRRQNPPEHIRHNREALRAYLSTPNGSRSALILKSKDGTPLTR